MMESGNRYNDAPPLRKIATEWQRWIDTVNATPAIRDTKVDNSRKAIAAGNYETEMVLDETLDRLALEMGVRIYD